jgi:hypothetical protein
VPAISVTLCILGVTWSQGRRVVTTHKLRLKRLPPEDFTPELEKMFGPGYRIKWEEWLCVKPVIVAVVPGVLPAR